MSYPEQQDVDRVSPEPSARILLIEDNAADIGLVREALQDHKVTCNVMAITDGQRAFTVMDQIDAGEEARPDLIIVDLNLPKKPGKEVLKRIRASANCQAVPIIVLTSSDNQRDKDEVAAYNPACYLRKPSKLDDFIKLGAVFKQFLPSY